MNSTGQDVYSPFTLNGPCHSGDSNIKLVFPHVDGTLCLLWHMEGTDFQCEKNGHRYVDLYKTEDVFDNSYFKFI